MRWVKLLCMSCLVTLSCRRWSSGNPAERDLGEKFSDTEEAGRIGYLAAVCQKYVESVISLVIACDDQFVRFGKRSVVFGVVSLSIGDHLPCRFNQTAAVLQ